ncbi:leucyl aminopeptidase [Alteromonas sp. LMIT006]|uniref:leucyl aminopeptidase n=1 Tax=Alteromonadaceae TaxID=72275 RepID=UPI0020CA4729|nr:leucyl aminopeptidase [Alteromonas sp. LMIT006]UTP72477.1 leucyl aminopeptidase [Alteromonas sp. LMIT006]
MSCNFSVRPITDPHLIQTDVLIVPASSDELAKLQLTATKPDAITNVFRPDGWQAKYVVLWPQDRHQSNVRPHQFRKAHDELFKHLDTLDFAKVAFTWQWVETNWQPYFSARILDLLQRTYVFLQYKTSPVSKKSITSLEIYADAVKQDTVAKIKATHLGTTWYRDIANQPANVCTPDYLAEKALQLAQEYRTITTQILDEEALAKEGMVTYLAVNRASALPASMPIMHYRGGVPGDAPIVLIGKGVTFDTGGISIKTAANMHGMIYDMCGAACMLGVLKSVAELQLPLNVTVILATAENHVDGNAYRPGDIYPTKDGQTVEIISTDAEGRLLLCEAMAYARTLKPKVMIDCATLTGAAITSLGHVCSGLMANDQQLAKDLIQAGQSSADYVWQFPLWDEYMPDLESEHADWRNSGRNSPGMITAGMFLKNFAHDTPWAHLDIAGTSFHYGTQNSTTGRPLYLLLEYLNKLNA